MNEVKLAQVDKLELIKALIIKAWTRETASPSVAAAWTESNPALGQCAVTALLVHEMMGGHIMRTVVPGLGSHYYNVLHYNVLPNGRVCDLTRSQFSPGMEIPEGRVAEREDILSSERARSARTQERYALLLSRFVDLFLGATI